MSRVSTLSSSPLFGTRGISAIKVSILASFFMQIVEKNLLRITAFSFALSPSFGNSTSFPNLLWKTSCRIVSGGASSAYPPPSTPRKALRLRANALKEHKTTITDKYNFLNIFSMDIKAESPKAKSFLSFDIRLFPCACKNKQFN